MTFVQHENFKGRSTSKMHDYSYQQFARTILVNHLGKIVLMAIYHESLSSFTSMRDMNFNLQWWLCGLPLGNGEKKDK